MIFAGTSGYVYDDWRGRFYPKDLPQEVWLEYYSQHFGAVEVNLTFYRLPASPVFRHWRTRTPNNFRFVLKGSRSITYRKRLADCHEELAQFFERASQLEEKWVGILWQLPPKFSHDVELLGDFLAESERAQLVYGKVWQAFELRDLSWFEEPIYEVLRQFNAAIAIADWPFDIRITNNESRSTGRTSNSVIRTSKLVLRSSLFVPLTADFLYFRRHGPAAEYASPYTEKDMKQLADELRSHLQVGRDLYVFFNNDANTFAIENARQLKSYF